MIEGSDFKIGRLVGFAMTRHKIGAVTLCSTTKFAVPIFAVFDV